MSHVDPNTRDIYQCPYCLGHVPVVDGVFLEHTVLYEHVQSVQWRCPHSGCACDSDDEKVG